MNESNYNSQYSSNPYPQNQFYGSSDPAAASAQPAYASVPQPEQVVFNVQPAPQVPPQPPKKRGISIWGALGGLIVVSLLVAILFMVSSCAAVVNGIANSAGYEKVDALASGEPHIGVIHMEGTIDYDGSECSPQGLKSLLKIAEEDSSVKGVVLFVNSGGGTATAGEEMSKYVRDFSKPIVVCSGAVNASAAYEISSQADEIYVANTTNIGSIGVIMQLTDLSGLYKLLGINIETIASADSKDSTYGNRPLTEEERAWYQGIVDEINQNFIQTVAAGRGLSIDEVTKLANGLSYTGMTATKNGLADKIGYIDDAVATASTLAGETKTLPYSTLKLDNNAPFGAILDLLSQASQNLELLASINNSATTGNASAIAESPSSAPLLGN